MKYFQHDFYEILRKLGDWFFEFAVYRDVGKFGTINTTGDSEQPYKLPTDATINFENYYTSLSSKSYYTLDSSSDNFRSMALWGSAFRVVDFSNWDDTDNIVF